MRAGVVFPKELPQLRRAQTIRVPSPTRIIGAMSPPGRCILLVITCQIRHRHKDQAKIFLLASWY
jgi:hypothetical protein